MNAPIHLYHQTEFVTIEISNKIANRMLCFKSFAP